MKKRMFDLGIAAPALVLVSPLLALAAIAIRLETRGPLIHRSQRIGRGERPFTLLKLRSMRVDAEACGPGITAGGDDRITRVGRVCRKFKIDELPQLWNVMRGDMSLVGPRPEAQRYVDWYDDRQRTLLAWRPGITSPASATYRNEETVLAELISDGRTLDDAYREIQTIKLDMELDYFPTATVLTDLMWMVRTVTEIVH